MEQKTLILLALIAISCIMVGSAVGFSYGVMSAPTKTVTTPTPLIVPTPTPTPTPIIVKENYTVVIDDLGRVVQVPRNVERVISTSSGIVEIIYALGCGEKLVGVDAYSKFPPQVENVTEVYGREGLNLEIALSLNPQVAFAWWYQKSKLEQLEQYIPVIYVNPRSVDDVLKTIKLIGVVLGVEDRADNLTEYMSNYIDLVEDRVGGLSEENKTTIYYELGDLGKTVGYGTFTNELITMAGGINIALKASTERYPRLTSEYIIQEDPDVIVVISWGKSIDEVISRPGWDSIKAVVENRVYTIESGWVTCSPRLILGLLQFAKWLHPDLFQDISVESVMAELYSTYYGVTS